MASAKFTVPFLKSSEIEEAITYDLLTLIEISGFTKPISGLSVSLDGEYDGLRISGGKGPRGPVKETKYSLEVGGQLYYEKVGIVISEDVAQPADSFVEAEQITATAYVKIISYTGKFNSQPQDVKIIQGITKNNWQEIKSGTSPDIVSFITSGSQPITYIGTSTGYGKAEYWDDTSNTGGEGSPFDGSDAKNIFRIEKPLSEAAKEAESTYSVNLYSADSEFNKSGDITGLILSKCYLLSLKLFCSEILYLDSSNNDLTTVDLSKQTKMTYLDLSYNKLTSLDISKLLQLDTVKVVNNIGLTSLDFTNLTKIKYVDIIGTGITSTNLDNLLISLNNSATGSGYLFLSLDQWTSRTSASDVAVNNLQKFKKWNISVK